MADNLLDLTTLIEQPIIKIDGKQYEILHPDQLGILAFQRLSKMAGRVSELMKLTDPNDDDEKELAGFIIDLSDRIMVGVPADVRAKLTESQRLAVAEVFMTLPRGRTAAPRRKAGKTMPSQSAGPRPRSGAKGSTAEARPDG